MRRRECMVFERGDATEPISKVLNIQDGEEKGFLRGRS